MEVNKMTKDTKHNNEESVQVKMLNKFQREREREELRMTRGGQGVVRMAGAWSKQH